MKGIQTLWDKALSIIETKVSKPSFETWLKSTKASALNDDTLFIAAPNEFSRDWLESRYSHLIIDTLYEITGENMKIKIVTSDPDIDVKSNTPPRPQNKRSSLSEDSPSSYT